MAEGGGIGHATGEGADQHRHAEVVHEADHFGGDGVDLVDELDLFFGDEAADDSALMFLVLNLAENGEGLLVDFAGEELAGSPEGSLEGGVGGEEETIVIIRETFEEFGACALVGDEIDIGISLAEIFEAEPGEAGLAAEAVGGVLADDADSGGRAGGHGGRLAEG